ncbi:hypothetical protein [Pseudalkalibacillus berkeleyi]|uniref:DUF4025 domain-containing protein n=1 Tax=Pseudalkalibacillus berkeleyi TaxID=1069813 RepID=A0ABS9GYH3_9BACL|nr:hypothetical protein [Pseudalkalibacillus berkeleyi]MCF6136740.1 hypothetical protein [Pseudalkalibacillus berkeleyi]
MGFNTDKKGKKQELMSDSALNPGYESSSLLNTIATSGNSVVSSHEDDRGLSDKDEIIEKELNQHNVNE